MEAIAVEIRKHATQWQSWWGSLTLKQRVLPVALMFFYLLVLGALGGLKSDHWMITGVVLVGSYGGPVPRRILGFILPLLLTAMTYDGMRFYGRFASSTIHVQEPYDFDLRFFGIPTESGVLTPNQWFELHTHPALDLLTGFFYLAFIPIFVSIAAYLFFWVSRTGTAKLPAERFKILVPQVMWAFYFVNVLGYLTYLIYPAAPPWYVALHGLGPAILNTPANAAGCLRFDALLGADLFANFYGRSANVFGAIPSLHVAYPFQAAYFAFRMGATRKFSLFFYLIMSFSAVYLNHHYVLDVLIGSLYALVVSRVVEMVFARKASNTPKPVSS